MSITNKCSIEHCNNLLKPSSRVTTCQACRSSFRYWQAPHRGVAAILVRQEQLEKWQDRIEYLGEKEKRFARAKRVVSAARS